MPINEDALDAATKYWTEDTLDVATIKGLIETYISALPVVSDEELEYIIDDAISEAGRDGNHSKAIIKALKQRGHL